MTPRVVTDPGELRELYGADTEVHIYALADLDEPYWSASTWWRRGDAAVGLVGLPGGSHVVYAVSSVDPEGTLALASDVSDSIPACLVTGVTGIAETFQAQGRSLAWHRGYHRYHLTQPELVPPVATDTVERLTARNDDEIQSCYGTDPGAAFFLSDMLKDNTFFGIRRDRQLVALAGTHVMSDRVSAAAVGAVFTHPDHRGMGYGATVTAAVVHELMGRVDTIGLNCTDANTRAIRIYEQMGFEAKLGYDECELR